MKFENSLIVSVKKARHKRLFILQAPLICFDNRGREWVVPKGFATDFASIPAIGRAFIDKAHQNAYAAVLHDYLYETQPLERRECDKLFKEALASPDCNTGPATQWLMYKAVRSGGWRSWQNVQNKLNLNPAMEIKSMAHDTIIQEEKGFFAKLFDWIKKARTKTDEELDELEDEVRLRANRLFRRANWPSLRDREILYKNRAQKDHRFWVSYLFVVLSSFITVWYWWSTTPELSSALFFGFVFGIGNLMIPVWARAVFHRGDGMSSIVVKLLGIIIFTGIATASIMASVGLQGINNDQMSSERAQQKLQYETQLAEATALKQRIAQLRQSTTRAPNEIKSELDGLLVTEPSPQSGCRSRDNYGSWSKRNCNRVSSLRTEFSQAGELKKLEHKAENLTFNGVPAVNSVNPQFDILSQYVNVDEKAFSTAKPMLIAIFMEILFDGFAIILTLIIGAEVREELRDRVARQRRDLINQAENEILGGGKPGGPEPIAVAPEPDPKPLSPAPLIATPVVQTRLAQTAEIKAPDGFALVPETKRETVTETTREVQSATLTSLGSTSFLEATEPEKTAQIIQEPALQIPVIKDAVEEAEIVPRNTITQAIDPVAAQELEDLKAKLAAQEAAQEAVDGDQADLKAEVLSLRFEKLSTARATPAEVQQLAKYALERFAYRVGQNIDLNFALKDYEAWCTKNGLAFNKPVQDFRSLIENDLGLTVSDTVSGAVVLVDTEFKT